MRGEGRGNKESESETEQGRGKGVVCRGVDEGGEMTQIRENCV